MRWREPTRDDRQIAWLWAAVVAGSLALGPLVVRFAPSLLPACTLRRLTGIPCPTCGSTRAMAALAAGDVGGAIAWNPLVTLAAVLFVAGGIAAPLWLASGGRVPSRNGRLPMTVRLGAVAVVAGNWVYLMLAGV